MESVRRAPFQSALDCVIGRASLANVERALEEAGDVFHGFAMSRADAVTPMMTLTQSFDLLLVEFHVHLVLARAALSRPSPLLLCYRGGQGASWMSASAGRMTQEQAYTTKRTPSHENMIHERPHMCEIPGCQPGLVSKLLPVTNVAQQNSKPSPYILKRMDTSVSKGESHGKPQSTQHFEPRAKASTSRAFANRAVATVLMAGLIAQPLMSPLAAIAAPSTG